TCFSFIFSRLFARAILPCGYACHTLCKLGGLSPQQPPLSCKAASFVSPFAVQRLLYFSARLLVARASVIFCFLIAVELRQQKTPSCSPCGINQGKDFFAFAIY